ncbi:MULTISPECIES: aromatic acid exporter family protein [Vagococcus]|uniref:Integral membrane protein n=1 Tax=Vagococcus fluvialis bH819 TaxID=1255619 RepID=A0A1X6WM57_9ENTE|nr:MULTISPECIES: aromatic acid exporter family protein [Vagococcus]SLM85322.1 Integral membrane protein [Vagococcus fluvialis bH819]
MKIGLRTIKTVITATLAIIIANYLGLKYPSTAGIIAILSVTNTKTSSFKVGIGRILALFVAILISFGSYYLLGYTPIAFGVYLLLYIPIAAKFKMSEAIPVNSVLVTHFLNEKSMSGDLVKNAILLLLVGVGLALISNLYMPNVEKEIETNKKRVDDAIKFLLKKMSETLDDKRAILDCDLIVEGVAKSIKQGEQYAKNHLDNQLLSKDIYEISYFQMRWMQLKVLEDMIDLIKNIDVATDVSEKIKELLDYIYINYAENNDGVLLKEKVSDTMIYYETKELPTSRKEFENRARLYQFLTETQTFIDIKVNFNQEK